MIPDSADQGPPLSNNLSLEAQQSSVRYANRLGKSVTAAQTGFCHPLQGTSRKILAGTQHFVHGPNTFATSGNSVSK